MKSLNAAKIEYILLSALFVACSALALSTLALMFTAQTPASPGPLAPRSASQSVAATG